MDNYIITGRKMLSRHLHPLPVKITVSEIGLRPEPKVMQSECRGCRNQEAVVIPNIHHKGSVSVFISAVSARVRRGDCKAPKLHDAIRIRFQHYRRNPSLIAETGLTAVILFVSFEGRLKIDSIPHYYMTQYITDNADR